MPRRRKGTVIEGEIITDQTGHNSNRIPTRDEVDEHFDRLDELHAAMESYCAGKRADIKDAYEAAANSLGIPRKILRKRYGVYRAQQKLESWKENLESGEHDRWVALDVALGKDFINTDLGQAAAAREDKAAA